MELTESEGGNPGTITHFLNVLTMF